MRLIVILVLTTVNFGLINGQNVTWRGEKFRSFAAAFLNNYIKCIEGANSSAADFIKRYLPNETPGNELSDTESAGNSVGEVEGSDTVGENSTTNGFTRSMSMPAGATRGAGGIGGLESGIEGNVTISAGLGDDSRTPGGGRTRGKLLRDRPTGLADESPRNSIGYITQPEDNEIARGSTKRTSHSAGNSDIAKGFGGWESDREENMGFVGKDEGYAGETAIYTTDDSHNIGGLRGFDEASMGDSDAQLGNYGGNAGDDHLYNGDARKAGNKGHGPAARGDRFDGQRSTTGPSMGAFDGKVKRAGGGDGVGDRHKVNAGAAGYNEKGAGERSFGGGQRRTTGTNAGELNALRRSSGVGDLSRENTGNTGDMESDANASPEGKGTADFRGHEGSARGKAGRTNAGSFDGIGVNYGGGFEADVWLSGNVGISGNNGNGGDAIAGDFGGQANTGRNEDGGGTNKRGRGNTRATGHRKNSAGVDMDAFGKQRNIAERGMMGFGGEKGNTRAAAGIDGWPRGNVRTAGVNEKGASGFGRQGGNGYVNGGMVDDTGNGDSAELSGFAGQTGTGVGESGGEINKRLRGNASPHGFVAQRGTGVGGQSHQGNMRAVSGVGDWPRGNVGTGGIKKKGASGFGRQGGGREGGVGNDYVNRGDEGMADDTENGDNNDLDGFAGQTGAGVREGSGGINNRPRGNASPDSFVGQRSTGFGGQANQENGMMTFGGQKGNMRAAAGVGDWSRGNVGTAGIKEKGASGFGRQGGSREGGVGNGYANRGNGGKADDTGNDDNAEWDDFPGQTGTGVREGGGGIINRPRGNASPDGVVGQRGTGFGSQASQGDSMMIFGGNMKAAARIGGWSRSNVGTAGVKEKGAGGFGRQGGSRESGIGNGYVNRGVGGMAYDTGNGDNAELGGFAGQTGTDIRVGGGGIQNRPRGIASPDGFVGQRGTGVGGQGSQEDSMMIFRGNMRAATGIGDWSRGNVGTGGVKEKGEGGFGSQGGSREGSVGDGYVNRVDGGMADDTGNGDNADVGGFAAQTGTGIRGGGDYGPRGNAESVGNKRNNVGAGAYGFHRQKNIVGTNAYSLHGSGSYGVRTSSRDQSQSNVGAGRGGFEGQGGQGRSAGISAKVSCWRKGNLGKDIDNGNVADVGMGGNGAQRFPNGMSSFGSEGGSPKRGAQSNGLRAKAGMAANNKNDIGSSLSGFGGQRGTGGTSTGAFGGHGSQERSTRDNAEVGGVLKGNAITSEDNGIDAYSTVGSFGALRRTFDAQGGSTDAVLGFGDWPRGNARIAAANGNGNSSGLKSYTRATGGGQRAATARISTYSFKELEENVGGNSGRVRGSVVATRVSIKYQGDPTDLQTTSKPKTKRPANYYNIFKKLPN